MPKKNDPAKRKKQLILIAVLLVGLLVAILTQPKPNSGKVSRDSGNDATIETVEIKPVSLKPDSKPTNDWEGDLDRFRLRELSRLELDDLKRMTLFRARPMEAALAGSPQASDVPIRVEAVYGESPAGGADVGDTVGGSALIGQAIVRPGETLPDGRTIVDVTSEGVAVQP